jgi:hypothetical protein
VKSRRSHPAKAGYVTLVWVSPGLPADRTELAAFLPSDVGLVPLILETPEAVFELPVGSLCVATVFEPDVLARLAERPQGVGLLVVGPEGHPGLFAAATDPRAADITMSASSVGEVAAAIRRAMAAQPAPAPVTAVPVRTPRRSKLIAVGAVLAGLAIGGVVIAATESSQPANASANAGPGFGGGFGGGGGGVGGGGFGGPAGPPGTGGQQGAPGGTGGAGGQAPGANLGAFEQELLTCLRQQGITTPTNQLLQNSGDPKLRQAFFTCVQQLGLSGRRGGRGLSSQLPGRP